MMLRASGTGKPFLAYRASQTKVSEIARPRSLTGTKGEIANDQIRSWSRLKKLETLTFIDEETNHYMTLDPPEDLIHYLMATDVNMSTGTDILNVFVIEEPDDFTILEQPEDSVDKEKEEQAISALENNEVLKNTPSENKEIDLTAVETEIQVESNAEAEVQIESNAEAEVQIESNAEAEVQIESNAEAEVQIESNAEVQIEVDSNVQAEVQIESNAATHIQVEGNAAGQIQVESMGEQPPGTTDTSEKKKRKRNRKNKAKKTDEIPPDCLMSYELPIEWAASAGSSKDSTDVVETKQQRHLRRLELAKTNRLEELARINAEALALYRIVNLQPKAPVGWGYVEED